MERDTQLIIVRGAGDIATGTIYKLRRCGYPVLALETGYPTAIRRQVGGFSEAVYEGSSQVEGMECLRISCFEEARGIWEQGAVPLLVDPDCQILEKVRPWLWWMRFWQRKIWELTAGWRIRRSPGAGICSGGGCDLVIETQRGHNLGRIIGKGCASADTGMPGIIAGYGKERVIHSPATGILLGRARIGDRVEKGDTIAVIVTGQGEVPVEASLTGIIRGLIKEGIPVTKGLKIADIDPREKEWENCFTISDKARCIAGSVLEGLMYLEAREEKGEKRAPAPRPSIKCGERGPNRGRAPQKPRGAFSRRSPHSGRLKFPSERSRCWCDSARSQSGMRLLHPMRI